MKKLTKTQKQILKRISQVNPEELKTISRFIQDEIFSLENGYALIVVPPKQIAIFYFRGKKEDEANRKRLISFLELISLIDYLLNEGLLFSFSLGSANNNLYCMCKEFNKISGDGNKIILNENGYYIDQTKPSHIYNSNNEKIMEGISFENHTNSVYRTVFKIINSPIIPSQELINFVENDFKTDDEIRYGKNLKYTKIALVVAILFGIISIVIGLCK